MANKEIELESGAKLSITTAPFADAHALLKALLKSAKGMPLNEEMLQMDLAVLKDVVIEAAVSQDVEDALFRCFQRAAYEGRKVGKDLLDDALLGDRARADYYEICWHVIRENCGPFFGKAFSTLRERSKTSDGSQKRPSVSTRP